MSNPPSAQIERSFLHGKPLAYIAMAQWVGVLHWKDYSAHWNLLFHQGLVTSNSDDEYKDDPPGTVIGQFLGGGGADASQPLRNLLYHLVLASERKVLDDPEWFYTIKGPQPRWFDQQVFLAAPQKLAGVPVTHWFWRELVPYAYGNESRAPDPVQLAWLEEQIARTGGRLDPELMSRYLARKIYSIGEGTVRRFNPTGSVPAVHTDTGERAIAFTSLARALRFLEKNPQKPVWVMAFDAPDYPEKVRQPSENAVWFVLTHPDYNTHPYPRRPLAAIYAPQRVPVTGHPTRNSAFREAIGDALAAANVQPGAIGRFFHDAGTDAPPGTGIGAMAQALTELDPGNDWFARSYDVDKYLRNAGAAAAAMNIAFATAYTNTTGKPALVVATRETDAAYAVTIAPPPGHVVPKLPERWPRARSVLTGYQQWWGERIPKAR